MTAFSPSDAALGGFRLIRDHPVAMLVWGLFYFAGIMVLGLVMVLGLGPTFVSFVKNGGLESGDAAAFGHILQNASPAFLLIIALTIFLMSVVTAGVYRLVLRPQEHTALNTHLKFGKDELRLTVANLVMFSIGMGFLFAIALTTALIAWGGGGIWALGGVALAVLMIWIGVRLSLATPMTFGEGRLSIAASWRLTRGHFWSLLGMILLATIFYLMVWAVVAIIGWAIMALSGGADALSDQNMSLGAMAAFVVNLIIQLVLPIVQVVMIYAPLAAAYRAIRDEDQPAPAPAASADPAPAAS